ncbi:hypothetical protein P775_08125 [Puniceibacterium antarcticum]|uniref:Uncharacterized protein n=1 Tax=Puniceibacterium antarcticum TaxID=1206336 RepID=A0A2G8RFW6_9RHOB|nr:hypothetical protein P775_08125 [Puniceibacterium antarcticum]
MFPNRLAWTGEGYDGAAVIPLARPCLTGIAR